MSHEQNIDDFLKLLKESVNQMSEELPSSDEKKKTNASLSEDALKKKLKTQYGSESNECGSDGENGDTYTLDQDFLKEMGAEESAKTPARSSTPKKTRKPKAAVATAEPTVDVPVEELVKTAAEAPEEELRDVVVCSQEFETTPEEDLAPWEIAEQSESEELEDMLVESVEEIENSVNEPEELLLMESMSAGEELIVEEEAEYQEFPEIQQITLTEWMRDYETEEESEENETAEDEPDVHVVELIPEELFAQTESVDSAANQLNDSVFDLMLRLGCEDELDSLNTEDVSEEFLEEAEEPVEKDDGDYHNEDQTEDMREGYRQRSVTALIRLLFAGALTLLLFFYDTLPLFGADFGGLTNYREYPGAYVLIGMQLLLLCALCQWRQLFGGIRQLFTFRANLSSMVVLLLVATIGYDVAMVFVATASLPPMFHFLTASVMLCSMISEFALLRREMKIFSIYSSITYKYTLTVDTGKHSMARKMYDGGLDQNKTVVAPSYVDFPYGFLRSLRAEGRGNRIYSVWMIPALLLALIAAVIGMLWEESAETACVAAMTVLFVALPLSTALAGCVSQCASASLLMKRGIALTGQEVIEEYAQGDVMIFRDLHLFKKCSTKDTGMVFYEQSQMKRIFGCLQLLYAHLGGPMAAIFEDVPESCRCREIHIRRITRGGIEAFVDRKHILLVGSHGFMNRYGLQFPEGETKKGRASLCISLDGKQSAKMSVKYEVEPVFEMLIERLAEEKIHCVVETYDPMIQTAFVASTRKLGHTPISVLHKNTDDLKYAKQPMSRRKAPVGLVVLSSRLKLCEAMIWCKRLVRLERRSRYLIGGISVLGILVSALLLRLGWMSVVNQYWLLLWTGLTNLFLAIFLRNGFPSKHYFTVAATSMELQRAEQKKQKRAQKRKGLSIKKQRKNKDS